MWPFDFTQSTESTPGIMSVGSVFLGWQFVSKVALTSHSSTPSIEVVFNGEMRPDPWVCRTLRCHIAFLSTHNCFIKKFSNRKWVFISSCWLWLSLVGLKSGAELSSRRMTWLHRKSTTRPSRGGIRNLGRLWEHGISWPAPGHIGNDFQDDQHFLFLLLLYAINPAVRMC